MLFETQPLLLVPFIVVTVEVWLRVREPLFAGIKRRFSRESGERDAP
jgi:hypothetical protein